jgi:hypothetical protein
MISVHDPVCKVILRDRQEDKKTKRLKDKETKRQKDRKTENRETERLID